MLPSLIIFLILFLKVASKSNDVIPSILLDLLLPPDMETATEAMTISENEIADLVFAADCPDQKFKTPAFV